MTVDSRQKGARAESAAKGLLKKHSGHDWERVPQSGALSKKHKLKGDLYVPGEKNRFCVEVKHYKDDHLTSKVLTDKSPQIMAWWNQAIRQGIEVDKIPLLLFKHDRGKFFVAFTTDAVPTSDVCMLETMPYRYMYYSEGNFFIAKLEDWLQNEDIDWII